MEQLDAAERRASLGSDYRPCPGGSRRCWKGSHERTGQRAVVLIDEYDKPILDTLEIPEVAVPTATICGDCTQSSSPATPTSAIAFLTGVSKFPR